MLKQKLLQSANQILTMSLEMKQSLHILQMPTETLLEFVLEESERNPLLEVNYESIDNLRSTYHEQDFIDNQSATDSLQLHLSKQIGIMFHDNAINKNIAHIITGYLDDNGYLTEKLQTICLYHDIHIKCAEHVVQKLKKLEPTGVYASNLRECLLLQCQEIGVADVPMMILLDNLELVGRNAVDVLSRMCDLSTNDVQLLINTLRTLNPKPGSLYNTFQEQNIIPDVVIKQRGKDLVIMPNTHLSSMVSLNQQYIDYTLKCSSPELMQHKKSAVNIVRAINQRLGAIQRVAEVIANVQYEFFTCGVLYLKPMNLDDVANVLNMHASTVSRISNKLIATDTAHYQLKYFFNSGVESNISENHYSSKAIQQRIKDLIKNENGDKPLSDESITSLLVEGGISIARRTVAKYRECAGFSGSSARRASKIR